MTRRVVSVFGGHRSVDFARTAGPRRGAAVSWTAGPGLHPGLEKWPGIWRQNAGQNPSPPACHSTCGGRLGGLDGCPEYGPEFWGHPISLERGGGVGGARHHGCSVHLSHEAGKQPCIWETDDCAIVSMAALAECLHLKSKKRAPQLTRRNAHIKLPDRQEDPCLAARSTGPLVVMGVRLRAVLRDSRRTIKVYVRFADP